jgi:hypothetical protein
MMARQWVSGVDLPAGPVTRVHIQNGKDVFCAMGKSWFKLDGERWTPAPPMKIGIARSITLPENLQATTPWEPVTAVLHIKDGPYSFWVGTAQGLCMREGDAWRALHSRRWLPDDHVNSLAVDDVGSIWVATHGGVSQIFWKIMRLEDKAKILNAMLQARHVRHGLVGNIRLEKPGNVSEYHQPSDDNDGLWTAMYMAAECFRYGVTKAPDAKANARKSLEALMFLEEVTGLPGFVARSIFEPSGGEAHGGEWHRSADSKWDWKGDTSSDELCGHIFGYEIYHRIVADEKEKQEIAGIVNRIMTRIVDDGYLWKGPGGKVTRWGVWSPEKLNGDLRWWWERGLNSLEILAFLRVAHDITANEKFANAIDDLTKVHAYHMNTVGQKIVFPPNAINHSDDELAFLPYYSLLMREKDPNLRPFYLASIERSWRIERPEEASLFNFIYGAGSGNPCDVEASIRTLQDIPMDMVIWKITNSTRRDVVLKDYLTRFETKQSVNILRCYERPLMRWNANPYVLDDGGNGTMEREPAHFLLPYWMGRYHGFIAE